jgi:hypothetical protein
MGWIGLRVEGVKGVSLPPFREEHDIISRKPEESVPT